MINYNKKSTVATTNSTTNYDLPLWENQDVTSWMGNLNDAMNKIDNAIWAVQEHYNGFQAVVDRVEQIGARISGENVEIKDDLTELETNFNALKTQTDGIGSQLEDAKQAIVNLQTEKEATDAMIESLQDDVGKLSNFIFGVDFDLNTNFTDVDGNVIPDAVITGISSTGSEVVINLHGTFSRRDYYISEEKTEELYSKLPLGKPKYIVGIDSIAGVDEYTDTTIRITKDGNRLKMSVAMTTDTKSFYGQYIMLFLYREVNNGLG